MWIKKEDCDLAPIRLAVSEMVEDYFDTEKNAGYCIAEEILNAVQSMLDTAEELPTTVQWEKPSEAPYAFFQCHQCGHTFYSKDYSIMSGWYTVNCPHCNNSCVNVDTKGA